MGPDSSRTVTVALAGVLLMALPSSVAAQSVDSGQAPDRNLTLLAGVGNSLGWFGAGAEKYVAGDRLSVFGGFGYTIPDGRFDNEGVAGAVGARGFTGGDHHRAVLEFAVSQIRVEDITVIRPNGEVGQVGDHLYGPGLSVGYQYAAGSGFTAMISGGVGVAVGLDDRIDDSPVSPLVNLGLGYTIR